MKTQPFALITALALLLTVATSQLVAAPDPGARAPAQILRVASEAVAPAQLLAQQGGEAFNIGVPVGDAYAPSSLAFDSATGLAYVYHSTVSNGSTAISVVNVDAGRVERLMRAGVKSYGAPGRLLLTPDGKKLLLHEVGQNTVSAIDPKTGAAKKLFDGTRDIALSADGAMLFVAGEQQLAAYPLPGLLSGKARPKWQSAASFNRLAINGSKLLAAAYAADRPMIVFDAATGTQLARAAASADLNAFAPGPDGGWGFVVAGEKPRLIRYDAALKPLGETAIPYFGNLSYDAGTKRFLAGGWRYDEGEPRGHAIMLAIDAADGQILIETRWPTTNPPTEFTPRGQNDLLAFSADGPSVLFVLDRATFTLRADIPLGVRAVDMAVDGDRMLYVADDLGRIRLLKLPEGKEVGLWQGGEPITLDAAHDRLYVNRDGRVVALDLRDGSVAADFPQGGYAAADPNRDLVYIADRGVTMYDRSGKKLGELPSTFPDPKGFSPNPYAYAAQVNPVTGHLAVTLHNGIPGSNGGSFLRIYEPQSDKFVLPPAPHSFVIDLLSDSKGVWYVAYSIARGQDAVQALSPDGKELRRLDRRSGFMALDELADNLYLFLEGRATRLAASTLTPLEQFVAPKFGGGLVTAPGASALYLFDSSGPRITPLKFSDLKPIQTGPSVARVPSESGNDSLSVIGEGKTRLVVGRFGEAFRSRDGKSWQRLLSGAGIVYGRTVAVSPSTIFTTGLSPAGGEGVWRSTDGGDTWEWLTGGLTDLAPNGPLLARGADEAYFSNRTQGLMRWNAATRAWEVAGPAAEGGDWSGLALAPDGALFRSNSGFLETSSDRGATWMRLGPTAETGDVIGFSSLYTVTHGIFSAVRTDFRYSGAQRSQDGGRTWQLSLAAPQIDFDGPPPELVSGSGRTYMLVRPYNGTPSLLRTLDFGDTWQLAPAASAKEVQHIAVDPLDGKLWLGVRGGVRLVNPDKLRWQTLKRPVATTDRPAIPSSSLTPTVAPCAQPLAAADAEVAQRGLPLGCPREQPHPIPAARQRFQNGQMIWRGDLPWIYVLGNDGTWGGYSDLWKEGAPADDPALVAPPGLQQPVRGFGKVWRENLGGPNSALGWALEKEQGVEAHAQEWDYGVVLSFGGEIIVIQTGGAWR